MLSFWRDQRPLSGQRYCLETDVRRERQAEGIAKAKRSGRYQRGVKRIDRARVRALKSNGAGPSAIAHEMGISRRQVYRILEQDT